MLEQLKAIYRVAGVAGLIKALLLPLAVIIGRWQAFKEQHEINERLQDAYDKVEKRQLTDEEIDNRLDAGTI